MWASSPKASWLAWNDRCAPRLAAAVYEAGAFERLPLLADALEEAGCDDQRILRVCRGQRKSPDGWWLIDLLLGQA